MTTEEKIKRYEELHPENKSFPTNKKPDEREEDMQWLDEKLAEFEKAQSEAPKSKEKSDSEPKVVVSGADVKVYTVNQIKCLPAEDFKKIEQEVLDGKARVVN